MSTIATGSTQARTKTRLTITVAVLLALALFGTGATTANAAYSYLNATRFQQEQSQWCWAATAKTIITFERGGNPSECTVVNWAKGSSSCANQPGTLGNVNRAIAAGGDTIGSVLDYAMTYSSVQSQINIGRLVVVRWGYGSTGNSTGHMVVIRGYNTNGNNVSYINPASGYSGYQWSSYSWMASNSSTTWTHTLYGMS